MAEETDDILMRKKVDGSDGDNANNHSGEKLQAIKKKVAAVPHYLRASTGSCHDACKYNKPHVFKEKPWRSTQRRMSAPLPDGEHAVQIRIFVNKKVKQPVEMEKVVVSSSQESAPANDKMRRSYPSSRTSPLHDSSKVVKQEAGPFTKSPSHEAPKLMRKSLQSLGKSSLSDALKSSKKEVPLAAKKDVVSKQTPLNVKERSASAGPTRPNRPVAKPSLSPDTSSGSSGKKTTDTKFGDNPRSSRVAVRKVVAPPATTLSLKRAPKVEMKKLQGPSATMSVHHSSVARVARTNDVRKTNSNGTKDQNQRSEASGKNRRLTNVAEPKKPVNETVKEKTLHMIETREDVLSVAPRASHFVQSPSPLSPDSLNSSSQTNSLSFTSVEVDDKCELDLDHSDSEADGSISNYNGSGDVKEVDHLKKGNKQTRISGDRDPASLQLKFRRGKVIDLQSETNSPRRLRFRKGRTLGDDEAGISGSRRKSFRRKAAAPDKKEEESGLAKVALKHQEVVAKKDEQVLLNNVIEETACKLVEKRKSKVKALVGAFESVISLQERKPSATKR